MQLIITEQKDLTMTEFNLNQNKTMKNFQVTFKSHNASNAFVMFESQNLKEALAFFNSENFEGFFSEGLNAIEHGDDYSEIELRKLIDGEISEFDQNEEGLEINAGWVTKEYSIK